MKKVTAPVLWFIVILLLGSAFSSTKFISKVEAQEDDPKIILVKLKEPPKTSSILSLSSSIPEGEFAGGLPSTNLLVYSVSGDTDTALAQARANPNVESAFPDVRVQAVRTTDDDQYEKQWGLFRMKVGTNPTLTPPIDSAWDKITNLNAKTANIKVAVIDSGVDFSLEELNSKLSEPAKNRVTCLFATGEAGTDCKPGGNDDYGHGTHVAGIIGAETDNSKGVAGVGWGVKLMSVKVLNSSGEGDFRNVLLGIEWAADNGAKVINLSLGAVENNFDQSYIDAINDYTRDAYIKGVVIVAAAGNCGDAVQHVEGKIDPCDKLNDNGTYNSHLTNPKMYPAAADKVLAVAAMGKENELAPYSEHGNWIDVAAPGGYGTAADPTKLILSTMKESYCAPLGGIKPTGTQNLCYLQGTSMSAPHVAGVLALIFAKNPNLTPDQAVKFLTMHADKTLPTGNSDATIYGAVDALASLTDVNANATPTGFATPSPTGPTRTPTPTRAPTLVPTIITVYPTTGVPVLPRIPPNPYPAPPFCPSTQGCAKKIFGDANCSGKVDFTDYGVWFIQFDTFPPGSTNNPNANFSCVGGNSTTYFVDMPDFEIWRRNTTDLGGITPTVGPTRTPTPNISVTPTRTPTPNISVTPTRTPTPRPPTNTPVPESCTLNCGSVQIYIGQCSVPNTKDTCTGAGWCADCGSGPGCYTIPAETYDCGCDGGNYRKYCDN